MNEPNVPSARSAFKRHAFDPYYRANAKGTGSALKLELHPAHDDTQGSIFAILAAQRTVPSRQNGTTVNATFDWQNGIYLKLDRTDLAQILQVLRGMHESVMEDKGLFHQSASGCTNIKFFHQIDPRPGYMLSVWKNKADGTQQKGYYFFSPDEALSLMLALEQAMLYVCFGIPEVIPRMAVRGGPTMPSAPVTVPSPFTPALPAAEQTTEPTEYRAVSGDPF